MEHVFPTPTQLPTPKPQAVQPPPRVNAIFMRNKNGHHTTRYQQNRVKEKRKLKSRSTRPTRPPPPTNSHLAKHGDSAEETRLFTLWHLDHVSQRTFGELNTKQHRHNKDMMRPPLLWHNRIITIAHGQKRINLGSFTRSRRQRCHDYATKDSVK